MRVNQKGRKDTSADFGFGAKNSPYTSKRLQSASVCFTALLCFWEKSFEMVSVCSKDCSNLPFENKIW